MEMRKAWLLAVGCSFIAASASAQVVSGRWAGLIDAGVDLGGDSPIVVKRESLVLDLTLRGDTVVGTVERGGRWRASVRGRFDGSRLELKAAALERGFYVNGQLVSDTVRYTWHATFEQSELRGSLSTDPTHPRMPPLRWEARRP
jgi:hypothetical protein